MLAGYRQHNSVDTRKSTAVSMLWAAIIVLPTAAYAQASVIGPTDLGQNLSVPFVYTSVIGNVTQWLSKVTGAANELFLSLFALELSIFGLQALLFKKADHLGELISGVALKVLGSGFILFLINAAPFVLFTITQGMGQLGQNVAGDTTSMNTLLNTGNWTAAQFLVTADILHAADVFNAAHLGLLSSNGGQVGLGVTAAIGNVIDECVLTSMALIIVAGMASVFMTWVAITMEAVIVMSGGIIFLGFAGTRFTMPFAQGYLRYVVAVGAKLLVFWLVVTMENLIMGNGTKAVQSVLANLSQIVTLGRVPLHGAQAGNPGCIPLDFPTTGIVCPIITPANPQPTPLMADLLPFTYVAFEFLLMGVIAYTIPLFAGRFLSGAPLMWRNLDGADSTPAVSVNEFRGSLSALLAMHARHTIGIRYKNDDAPAASHTGTRTFTTDTAASAVDTIFSASALPTDWDKTEPVTRRDHQKPGSGPF
jgi:P-type conjugative transfer protein TrbL